MAEERPTAASERRYQTHIAVLLAAAALTTALIGARTANLAGAAGGAWETGVRVQAKRGVARTSAEFLVHTAALPNVAKFQEARIRTKEYLRELRRSDLTQVEYEALRVLALVESERTKAMFDAIATEQGYFDEQNYDNFDLDRRLADERRESLRGLEDPQEVRAAGDDRSTDAVSEALAGLPAALAILLVSIAQVVSQTRKALLWAGAIALTASITAALALEVVAFH
jgi:hypothetical protein